MTAETDFLDYIAAKPLLRNSFLQEQILQAKREYQYVVIDTPPSIGQKYIEMFEELSDVIVVPFFTQDHSFQGVSKLLKKQIKHPKEKCITVHFRDYKLIEIVKKWYDSLYNKYGEIIELSKAFREIYMYADVPKNINNKALFSKSFKVSQRDVYTDLKNLIFGE